MASRGNPNVPRKSKKMGNRAKVQRRNAGKIAKNPRGGNSSTVLHPTGGANAPISAKKQRKIDKAINHSRQRAIEQAMAEEGEVAMTDAPMTTKSKKVESGDNIEKMEVDEIVS